MVDLHRRYFLDHRYPQVENQFQAMKPQRAHVLSAIFTLLLMCVSWISVAQSETSSTENHWKTGNGRRVITPEIPIWMSGYASRTEPASGVRVDLWAKALAIRDARGESVILVTLDLVGMGRELSMSIRESIARTLCLKAEQIHLCFSHTHTGPVVGDNLRSMYFLNEDQWQALREYEKFLEKQVHQAALEAWENVEESKISWATGRATLGVNRRNNREADVLELRKNGALVGPVDYSVPTLAVRDLDGKLKTVVFGYACHSTTLSDQLWSGDYPGFAQLELESGHPELQAMFWAGCGADVNPLPRRKPELAEDYGRQLAGAVEMTLNGVMQPLSPRLSRHDQEIPLPFDTLPTRAEWESQSISDNRYLASRAAIWLERLDAGKEVPAVYPYPVAWWRLGESGHSLDWVFMGGEVVVDYALKSRELWGTSVWVTSYFQDVMGYVPSRRVWEEGGYEGESSAIYYGLPARWDGAVEEIVWESLEEARASLQ